MLDGFAAVFGEQGGDDDDVGGLAEEADGAVYHGHVRAGGMEAVDSLSLVQLTAHLPSVAAV